MIISNSRRFIFIHVPKTAGTSVTNLFEPDLRWNDLVLGGSEFGERIQLAYRERFGLFKHAKARDVRRILGEAVWSDYFSFAFVRHPYARLVSFYRWKRDALSRAAPDSRIWNWGASQAFLRSKNFSEFIRDDAFLGSLAAQPQAEWVSDDQGRCIVGFVGRYEELAAGIRVVTDRIGIPADDLARDNASTSDPSPGLFFRDESDYDFVREIHRRDFEMFGYDDRLRL